MVSVDGEGIRGVTKEGSHLPGVRAAVEEIADRDQRIPGPKLEARKECPQLPGAAMDVADCYPAIEGITDGKKG
jgi:hypothetical protein